MLRTRSLRLLLIAGLIVFVSLANAQSKEDDDKEKEVEHKIKIIKTEVMRGEHECRAMGDRPMIPDLTDEQREKIETLRVKHMKEMLFLKNEMGEKRARLQTLTTAEKVNMSEVDKLLESIGALHTNIMKKQVQHRQHIRELLTDKQRVIFDAHMPGPGECHGGKGPRPE